MNEDTNKLSRAATLNKPEVVLDKFFDEMKTALGLAFKPHPSDIITPYAKCCTTLLQQITHELRTRGSIDFDEINSVVPWNVIWQEQVKPKFGSENYEELRQALQNGQS